MREIDPAQDAHDLIIFATCAKAFAVAIDAVFRDATGDAFTYEPSAQRMLADIDNATETLWGEMQRCCQRFGIGIPQPETATEGSPSTVADVGAETTTTTNKDH